jgi:hypothetical protein
LPVKVQGSSLRPVRSVPAAAFPLKKEFWIPQMIRVLGPTGGAAESCSAPDGVWGTTCIASSTMEMGMAIKQNSCCRCLACRCRLRPLVHAFSSEWTLNGNTVSWNQPMLHLLPMGSLLRDSRTLEWDNIVYGGSRRGTYRASIMRYRSCWGNTPMFPSSVMT